MGKYEPKTNVHYEQVEIEEPHITRITIEDAKRTIRIGEPFEYYKKLEYGAKGEYKDKDLVHGRIVEKYSNFFIVEAENGRRESIRWIDLILAKSNGKGIVI